MHLFCTKQQHTGVPLSFQLDLQAANLFCNAQKTSIWGAAAAAEDYPYIFPVLRTHFCHCSSHLKKKIPRTKINPAARCTRLGAIRQEEKEMEGILLFFFFLSLPSPAGFFRVGITAMVIPPPLPSSLCGIEFGGGPLLSSSLLCAQI